MGNEAQQDSIQSLGEAMSDALDRVEAVGSKQRPLAGLSTGFTDLDALTGGLMPGTLTVIAARPSMGRSTLLLTLCTHAAVKNSVPTLHVSLEHSVSETTLRVKSAEARVALHHMRSGLTTDDDWTRLAKVIPQIAENPLCFWSPARMNASQLTDRAREEVEKRQIGLIAIDGIQDIRPMKRSDLREREVGDVVRDLKSLARELNIPLVCTSHLNRGAETRADRVPMLDDLRESGAITYAADTIILLHRPDHYDLASERAGEADFIVAKHRDGPTARITVASRATTAASSSSLLRPERRPPRPRQT